MNVNEPSYAKATAGKQRTTKKSHRPISRILSPSKPGSLSFIWSRRIGICAAYPPCSRRIETVRAAQESTFRQIGKVYMAFQPARFIPHDSYLPWSCALTARFHLYPPKPWREASTPTGSNFLRHFLCPRIASRTPPVRRCGALCCPDFPPLKATKRPVAISFYDCKGTSFTRILYFFMRYSHSF